MRRKLSGKSSDHDLTTNDSSDGDDPTPSKFRRPGLFRGIDHGSSDYNNSTSNGGGGGHHSPQHSQEIHDSPISPGAEGLHHRKKLSPTNHHHHYDHAGFSSTSQSQSMYPQQQAASSFLGVTSMSPNDLSRSRLHYPNNGGKNGNAHGGTRHSSRSSSRHKKSLVWKRLAQSLFVILVLGYLAFLYLAEHHYSKREEERRVEEERRRESLHSLIKEKSGGKGGKGSAMGDKGGDAKGGYSRFNEIIDRGGSAKSVKISDTQKDHNTLEKDAKDYNPSQQQQPQTVYKPKSINDIIQGYAFQSTAQQSTYKEPLNVQKALARNWSKDSIKKAKKDRKERLKSRRQRTTPPVSQKGKQPLWYELDYDSEATISTIQQRWATADNKGDTVDLSEYSLCGTHANEAAKYHPQNYLPPSSSPSNPSSQQPTQHPQPLGPESRILITGILSPLGLHLALALHRQCNVTSFLGLDAQFPNEPTSRLEAQERLAILMQEFEGEFKMEVPFLGLEVRDGESEHGEESGKIGGWWKRRKRERMLKKLSMESSNNRYGIPSSPGTDNEGKGALDAILEYRPTHIVHLAGTQSDSLLNSNYHAQSTSSEGVSSPSLHPQHVFADRDEEEDDILKETISSRPHLYDLRTGVVGMEQLLSGIVAQTMLPPNILSSRNPISDEEKQKMVLPKVVYASSYDALYFRNAAGRLNHKKKRDEESLGSMEPPVPKRPLRGIHGASRLADELLASSYYALHNIPTIGLRFDAIYGPRGFGVPSTSVPIFNANRIKRTKRGVSPDVDLAETAVRGVYRRWTEAVKEKQRLEAEEEEEEEEESGDEGRRRLSEYSSMKEERRGRRRLLSESSSREMNLIEEAGWMHLAHDRRDYVLVEDAVSAIIAAMQYKSVNNSPTTFNIGSGEMSTLSSLAEELQELALPEGHKHHTAASLSKDVIDVERSSAARAASLTSNDYLRWTAKTSLKDGAARLLAWHLDRALPFFPPASASDEEVDHSIISPLQEASGLQLVDGEGILKKRGMTSCDASNDPTCLRELHATYPCSSECATQSCYPSVFDSVLEITHEVTEDCDVVLYTMVMGYDVDTMALETEYSDGEEQEQWMESTVCTLAFVPSESTLIREVIDKVPPSSLVKRGVSVESEFGKKVKALNGYLAHKGWVLIMVDGTTKPLTAEDMFVPKLSPARLFHSTVRKAMFVDENFAHTPFPEDAQFLASETSRGVLGQRTVTGPDAKGHKTKYKLPEEPQRRAVLLVSPMRKIPDVDGDKMPLEDITITLMTDIGMDPDTDGEPREIQTQREFYTRARSLINSMDLRSPNSVIRHTLEIKDFIRSKWIIHHLKLEEGHQLRCEWYREHVRWGNHLDQLSFAYIMAKRELARKIITQQPLISAEDKEELTILQKIIRIKSDAHEWHPLFSSEMASSLMPIHHMDISPKVIPVNLQDLPENEISDVKPDSAFSDVGSTFYVRIMSDERMMESRKRWVKMRNNHRKYVAMMREKEGKEE